MKAFHVCTYAYRSLAIHRPFNSKPLNFWTIATRLKLNEPVLIRYYSKVLNFWMVAVRLKFNESALIRYGGLEESRVIAYYLCYHHIIQNKNPSRKSFMIYHMPRYSLIKFFEFTKNYENYTKIYKVRKATTKISSKSVKLFNSRIIEKQNSTMRIEQLDR